MASQKGKLFAERGNLYVITGVNTARMINADNTLGDTVTTEDCEHKFLGSIALDTSLQHQIEYWQARSLFFERKYDNTHKINLNTIKDFIKSIKSALLTVIDGKFAGNKKILDICKIGKQSFTMLQKMLLEQMSVKKWKETSVSYLSEFLTAKATKLLIGKKYPKIIGSEKIEVQGLRIKYVHKKGHIQYRSLRLEVHITSTNTNSDRVIGSLEQKNKKKRAKQKKRLRLKQKQKFELMMSEPENKKKFGAIKAGQCMATPDDVSGARIFYVSLYKEDKQSLMAITYCLYFGCFEQDKAAQMFEKYKGKLLSIENFMQ